MKNTRGKEWKLLSQRVSKLGGQRERGVAVFFTLGAAARNGVSEPSKELVVMIEAAGSQTAVSLSKGENRFLVQADPASASNKSEKAKTYGTTIVSEEQLMEMLGQ